jgi:hypothetical protein
VDRWCRASNRERGEALPIATVWKLSKAWYDNRLSEDYRGRSASQVQEIFRGCGLTSAFWALEGDPDAPQK